MAATIAATVRLKLIISWNLPENLPLPRGPQISSGGAAAGIGGASRGLSRPERGGTVAGSAAPLARQGSDWFATPKLDRRPEDKAKSVHLVEKPLYRKV